MAIDEVEAMINNIQMGSQKMGSEVSGALRMNQEITPPNLDSTQGDHQGEGVV